MVAAERYQAVLQDSTVVEDAEVREWERKESVPKLAGRSLFDPGNPLRWLRDRQQSVASPEAFVEFGGGDRLAGEVVEYHPVGLFAYESVPPHLYVRLFAEYQHPEYRDYHPPARVSLEFVRRIVWKRSGPDEYRPGTVFLRNGGQLSFRALRWSNGSVQLLQGDGVREVPWSDLAELHLPAHDDWSAYFDQLALLSPGANSRLLQVELNDGSRWTTSLERFQPLHWGDPARQDAWLQLFQPAWSLDPFWARFRSIVLWRSWQPEEVPLSLIQPERVQQVSAFGKGRNWRLNTSVRQGPLQSGSREFGWGFGVQATTELVFPLPGLATHVRTKCGLDRSSGNGGCVAVSVAVDRQLLHEPPLLVGTEMIDDTSWRDLPEGDGTRARTLRLVADMAHERRPAGADPFDIRDATNWGEPEVRLDRNRLQQELLRRSSARLAGLNGWTLLSPTGNTTNPLGLQGFELANVLDTTDGRDQRYRSVFRVREPFVVLQRKLKIGDQQRWLGLQLSRFTEKTTPTRVQVRINGVTVKVADVPERNHPSDPDAIAAPVDRFVGQTVNCEVILLPRDQQSWLEFRGMALSPNRPGIWPVFEDEPELATALRGDEQRAQTVPPTAQSSAELTTETPYTGRAALKTGLGVVENARLPGLGLRIREAPRLGEYRFITFAWKHSGPGGQLVRLKVAHEGRFGEQIAKLWQRDPQPQPGLSPFAAKLEERGLQHGFAYEAGTIPAQPRTALRLNGESPTNWTPHQRDLFADFGPSLLTGLSFESQGAGALWDHLYLARTWQDWEWAKQHLVNPPPPVDPNAPVQAVAYRPEEQADLLAPRAAAFQLEDSSEPLYLINEHAGHRNVLRTHPISADRPAIFRTAWTFPAQSATELLLLVGNQPQSDWRLSVCVNGEEIFTQRIDDTLTAPSRGLANLRVDLRRYAGQTALIEVRHYPGQAGSAHAAWKRIELREAEPD